MKVVYSPQFLRSFKKLSKDIQENFQHPSLRIKKIEGHSEIWEDRVSKDYRFTFQIERSIYFIRRVGTHAILRKP